ncbi:putative alpha-N-acetylgalactosaminidase [Cavenderia fasciculata]|uniref:Alpha-galactosidase n=1 Tax=Cavenderia fasciculata TaxID=261658 RepID=F4Q3X9_CACFS|nr:putative alpha-N-acetylgalactosaminidase [Cavenderia fasciculata]EGG17735.1 putative alpha-N-acetylgalactosaminidase [Cavenderia fasciculata]|eukprot:XP_004356219.1 putative alpha-N-acetylgalactosaminidase [Cavenderia fasciculata]
MISTPEVSLDIGAIQSADAANQQLNAVALTDATASITARGGYKPSNPPKMIIMFDGVCNVCDTFVHFVYPRDVNKKFSFQALQTTKGREIQNYYGVPTDLSTVILIDEETATYTSKSTAVLRIMYHLQSPYSYLYQFHYLPAFFRDFCYSTFARYRYLLMGKKDTLKGLNNGVAITPPMGWNTWNHFGCDTSEINSQLIYETATAMVTSGMAAVGYEYINLDDCWLAKERDADGRLQADPIRFPQGIAPLADYVHSLGLKMGIYEDVGNLTCGGYPGSENYFEIDMKTFAEWGMDYVKMDGCYFPVDDMEETYTQLSEILNATGRPMVYSCSWPTYAFVNNQTVNFTYIGEICNLWREFDDIRDNFDSWTGILDQMMQYNRAPYASPGHWNDPDMLEIGNGGQTTAEYQSFFSLWSIIAAPLIAGNDIRNMSADIINILTNADIIAVDQDALGIQGQRAYQSGTSEVWTRPLVGGAIAAVLFNRGEQPATIELTSDILQVSSNSQFLMRDLWQKTAPTQVFQGSSSFSNIDAHAVIMLKLSPITGSFGFILPQLRLCMFKSATIIDHSIGPFTLNYLTCVSYRTS